MPVTEVKRKTHPLYKVEPKPQKLLLLNTYNVAAKNYRDNKKELFVRLIDSIMVSSVTEIQDRENINVTFIRGLSELTQKAGSSVFSIMTLHNATHCIVIDSFDVRFQQTDVNVTKSGTSKSREAFYDIISEIGFSFFNEQGLYKHLLMKEQRYHSSRNVISGLLAAGPNIVAQRKDAYGVTFENTIKYLDLFFEGR